MRDVLLFSSSPVAHYCLPASFPPPPDYLSATVFSVILPPHTDLRQALKQVSELESLANSLSESVKEKSIALTHQKKANKSVDWLEGGRGGGEGEDFAITKALVVLNQIG